MRAAWITVPFVFSVAVVACGPQSSVRWSINPALDATVSNVGIRNGAVTGAVLVTENGEPVAVEPNGFLVETLNADGQWVRANFGSTPSPTPGDDPTPTPTPGTDPTPTPDGSPTPTPDASPTATPEGNETPSPSPTPALLAIDAAVVGDVSGSEANHDTEIQGAVRDLGNEMLGGIDRLGLVRVSSGASILSALTTSASDFSMAADALVSNYGYTALWDGIRRGNEVVDVTSAEPRYKAIVVFTDGMENNSADENGTGFDDGIDTTYDDLLALQAQGVTPAIWTVGVGDQMDEATLQTLSTATGGQYLHIADIADLPAALHAAQLQMHTVAPMSFHPEACSATTARITVRTQRGAAQKIVKIPSTCH